MTPDALVVFGVGAAVGWLSTLTGIGAGSGFLILAWVGLPLPAALLWTKLVMTAQDASARIGIRAIGSGADGIGSQCSSDDAGSTAGDAGRRPGDAGRTPGGGGRTPGGAAWTHVGLLVAAGAAAAIGAAVMARAPVGVASTLMAAALMAACAPRRSPVRTGVLGLHLPMALYIGGFGMGAGAVQRMIARRSGLNWGECRPQVLSLGMTANGAAALTLCGMMRAEDVSIGWPIAMLAGGQALGALVASRWLQRAQDKVPAAAAEKESPSTEGPSCAGGH